MKVIKRQYGDIDELTVEGEVDASSSIGLDAAISASVDAGCKKIIVHCARLEYISSAGMGVFMSYIEEFKVRQIYMVIVGLNSRLTYNFDVLGLKNLLHFANTLDEAKRLIDALQV